MAQTNSKNDSPKGEPKRKFSQSQYEMLKRCSDNKDMTEWNEWRKNNPDEDIFLEGADLFKFSLAGALLGTGTGFVKVVEDKKLDFKGKVYLQQAIFAYANLNFTDFRFSKLQNAFFNHADLEGASFWGANLKYCSFSWSNLKNAHLEHSHVENARLDCAILKGANLSFAKLKGADMDHSILEEANVRSVEFDRKTRCLGVYNKDCYGSALFELHIKDTNYLWEFAQSHPIIYRLWFILSDCGRSIALWAGWSLLFAVLFAHKFFALGPGAIEVTKLPWRFETVLYYSVVTFTTLGFGDVVPKTNAAAWWVMAEVITGYVMLGGLISIFANKLARRS